MCHWTFSNQQSINHRKNEDFWIRLNVDINLYHNHQVDEDSNALDGYKSNDTEMKMKTKNFLDAKANMVVITINL